MNRRRRPLDWGLALVCAQALFQMPCVQLDGKPGANAVNLFTPLLCGLCGAAYWSFGRFRPSAPAIVAMGSAFLLVLASALANPADPQGFSRGFALLVCIVSGLICGAGIGAGARADFKTEIEQGQAPATRPVLVVSLGLFALFLSLNALIRLVPDALPSAPRFHHNELASLILLASTPIALLVAADVPGSLRVVGVAALAAGFALLFGVGSRAGMLLAPLAWLPASIPLLRPRGILVALSVAALGLGGLFLVRPEKIPRLVEYESVDYRLECIPLSLEIIAARPWTGIGLRADRTGFLVGREIHAPGLDPGRFRKSLSRIVTPENSLLALATGLGLPFTLLYAAVVFFLGRCALGAARTNPAGRTLIRPMLAVGLHCLVYDGLLIPQVCFGFHLLLGAAAFSGLSNASRNPAAASAEASQL